MSQPSLALDDRRISWASTRWLSEVRRGRVAPVDGYLGVERDGELPVAPEALAVPRACAAGVTLPPPVELPAGAVDRARATLGRGGDWPCPQPGRFCDGGEDEQEGEG